MSKTTGKSAVHQLALVLPHAGAPAAPPESGVFKPEDYAVGRVLCDRFRVERVIGVGSMGVVVAARHIELDERVAIKFIRADMQQLPGVVSRFAREAKAAATIKSEHVAQVLDVGTVDPIGPFIVMEYLDGRDLGDLLELDGRLPVPRAVHYVLQACEALAVAHASGITHRDIKPENLFVTRQGELEVVKLLDFGISKAALTGRVFGDELSSSEAACLLGTPLYMSPEQIQALDDVDHRSDIWSLGVVLYELVTAQSAFVAESVPELWTRIMETEPASIAAYCPEAPDGLQGVIDRCLEKDPARRFQSVAELAAALQPFAPTGARLYARRVAAILGARDALGSTPFASPASTTGDAAEPTSHEESPGALVPLPTSAPALLPQAPARSTSARRAALLAAGAGLAVALLALGYRRAGESGSVAAAPVASRRGEPAADQPVEPAQPGLEAAQSAELSVSRTVLVESEPSGARVELEGQLLGVTPLSTLLPAGTLRLTISKRDHVDQQVLLHVDAAPPGAKPVHTHVVLQRAPGNAEGAEPNAARAPQSAARSTRSSESGATRREASPRRVEERPRLRLVDDLPRLRLVD